MGGPVCKGVCKRYKAVKTEEEKTGNRYYEYGYKRCSECELFLAKEYQVRCPCCGLGLREKPKLARHRQQYLERNNIVVRH